MVGAGVASLSLSVLVVVRSCRCSLLSVVRCCPSFDAVLLRSCPSRVVKLFCVAGVAFGDGCHQRWCCCVSWVGVVQSWPVVRVGGFRGSSLSFAGRCVLCVSLLPLLGSCRVVLGGCSRFGCLAGGIYATLHGSDVVTRRMQVVIGRCVKVMGGIVGVVVAC